jgi:sigma-B regulation protein RsbU (phosphoserine phosphatase)
VATTLQRSLLPPRLPVVPGIGLAARFRAAGEANQVGGDFYDLFPVDDGWIVVIGDVTGKGPDAAAITSLARYTIRTAALYERDPAGIMQRLNHALLAEDEHRQMCTAVCLKVMPGSAGAPVAVRFVCAGHPPPFLVRAPGQLEELCRAGPLLGAFGEAAWDAADVELGPGDGIVLYTDGVTDARGAGGRFGQQRLEQVLREVAGNDADAIAEALDVRLLDFQQGPQRDDVAVLVLRADSGPRAPQSTLVAGSATAGT